VPLVVAERLLAGGIDEYRAVRPIDLVALRVEVRFDDAHNEIAIRFASDALGALGEGGVLHAERRGFFGPDDQPVVRLRRVDVFWNLRRLNRADANIFEDVHLRGMELQPVRRLFLRWLKIGLNQVRVMRGNGVGDEIASDESDEAERGGDDEESFPEALAPDDDCVGKKRTVGGDEKAEAPDSGDRRQLDERDIPAGGVAGQIPREADVGQVRAREFERDPQERRENERQRAAFFRSEGNS